MKKRIRLIALIALAAIAAVAAFLPYPLLYKGGDNITIVESLRVASLEEIVSQDRFKDKTLFIELWGTYCAPCIAEFGYAGELKERFGSRPVEFLYLCAIDRIQGENRTGRSTAF
ncbi:MAG: hypothetical protein LBU80_06935 [Rikenellaceae bacterium]|jgi:thiol-disulfide isomerase/thioredoxin|nr:hypothetical protein [Rikenellaceae bacterium]